MRRIKVYFHTLGCKVNQYDTQLMIENLLIDERFKIVKNVEEADVFVINTCVVTEKAEKESIRLIRKFSSKGKVVAVGCLPQKRKPSNPKVIYLNLEEEKNIRGVILSLFEQEEKNYERVESIKSFFGRTRAFVKVQEGCNRFCSYCIVAYLRDKVRSKKIEDVLNEVKELLSNGYKEIVLTGTQIGLFGVEKGQDLSSLIREIIKIPSNFRVRISSINPEFVNKELVEVLKEEKVCPHLHLSLQSGSDKILKLMRRRYTVKEYLHKVELLKKEVKNMVITTDIIVGFPGETEEDFEKTIDVVKKAGFLRVHIFPYSKREGTLAAKMKNRVPKEIIEERKRRLKEVVKNVRIREIKRFIGKSLIVLSEDKNSGYTENYIRIRFNEEIKENNFYKTYLQKFENGVVYGKIERKFCYSPIEKGGEKERCQQLKEEREKTWIV